MENENYGMGDTAANVRDRVSEFGNKAADTAAKAADTAKSRVAAIGEVREVASRAGAGGRAGARVRRGTAAPTGLSRP
jgi:hypothetical protein